MRTLSTTLALAALASGALAAGPAAAQDAAPSSNAAGDADQELAKQLSNPVSSLISFPLQENIDFGIGPDNGMKSTFNIQPVVPISLSSDWNLILRKSEE